MIKEFINKAITVIKQHQDKIKHAVTNLLIVAVLGTVFKPLGAGALVIGVGMAMIVSILKELYDEYSPEGTGWNWNDVIADIIGIILGIIIVVA